MSISVGHKFRVEKVHSQSEETRVTSISEGQWIINSQLRRCILNLSRFLAMSISVVHRVEKVLLGKECKAPYYCLMCVICVTFLAVKPSEGKFD